MPTRTTAKKNTRPAKDEWGVYDPEQAGLAALYARIDAKNAVATADSKADKADDQPVAVLRYHN